MESILAQTLPDWELIVCDSYSDDGSWEFFQKFKDDPRVRLYQIPREGVIASVNECLKRSKGEYLYIAPSDDTAVPELLESLAKPLERFPDLSIAVCDFQGIDEHSRPLPQRHSPLHNFIGEWMDVQSIRDGKAEFFFHVANEGLVWGAIVSVLLRRTLFDEVGMFDTKVGPTADDPWALRACLASDIACVPGKLASFRRHETQITQPFTRGTYLAALKSVKSVIYDDTARIPVAWRTLPQWDDNILAVRRFNYLNSFNLYRWCAKKEPWRFLKGLKDALRSEPKWLLTQALGGFGLAEEAIENSVGERVHAMKLIRLFGASWPPTTINGGW